MLKCNAGTVSTMDDIALTDVTKEEARHHRVQVNHTQTYKLKAVVKNWTLSERYK